MYNSISYSMTILHVILKLLFNKLYKKTLYYNYNMLKYSSINNNKTNSSRKLIFQKNTTSNSRFNIIQSVNPDSTNINSSKNDNLTRKLIFQKNTTNLDSTNINSSINNNLSRKLIFQKNITNL